ncbi:hypothetical protein ACLKA6_019115 [Drosophila palustris]
MSEINRLMARRRILNSRIQQLQEPGDHVLRNQLKQLKEEQKKTKQIIKNMKKKMDEQQFFIADMWRRMEQHPGLQQQHPVLLQQRPAAPSAAAPAVAAPAAAASGAAAPANQH